MRLFEPSEGTREEPKPLVVVATRGRPHEVKRLVAMLADQDTPPFHTVVIGVVSADLPAFSDEPSGSISLLLSKKAGSAVQRNVGLQELQRLGHLNSPRNCVVFFDDDFRPADSWLRLACETFRDNPRLVGLTGQVLADGINGDAIEETLADAILSGKAPQRPHWSSGASSRPVESLYGCNMAVTSTIAAECRFDEDLPLYSWQEDCDYTGQARRFGETRLIPACRGVHLGVKSARSSGLRLGYSQIANPIRICRRKNMTRLRLVRFLTRALAANALRTLSRRKTVDYRGRLNGNMLALVDLLRGRCSPGRILDLPG